MTTFTSWDTELYHSGKKGMKWGIRRYQNEDGSLTPLGRIHYGYGQIKERRAQRQEERKQRREERKASNIKNMSEADLRKAINRKKLELEYKELTKSKRFEKGLSLVDKLSSAYIENKKRKDEATQKANDQKLEKQRLEVEKQRLEVEQKKADAAEQQAIAEKNKSKLDLTKLETRAGRRMLAREAKTPLIKAKAELRRAKLDTRKSKLWSRVMDLISKNQDETWKAAARTHEINVLGLKNLGQEELTKQAAERTATATKEAAKAESEYNKQLAYNEGKRLEYAENAAKRQYDREEKKDKKDKKN